MVVTRAGRSRGWALDDLVSGHMVKQWRVHVVAYKSFLRNPSRMSMATNSFVVHVYHLEQFLISQEKKKNKPIKNISLWK